MIQGLLEKKQCAISLLKEDIELYQQFLPKIEKMNDKDFEQLFCGNVDHFKEEPNYHFKLLVYKFQNFASFLIAWYNKNDKIIYLKDIWKNYISIGDLRNLGEKEKIEKFMIERTNYKNWPLKIKEEFNKNISGYINNNEEVKIAFKNLSDYEKNLYAKLEEIKKEYGKEYKGIEKISENYQFNLLKKVCPSLSSYLFEKIKNQICIPSYNGANNNISKLVFDLNQAISKAQPVLTEKVIPITEGVIGLANLLFGIIQFKAIDKEVEKFTEFQGKLKKIQERFNENVKKIMNNDNLFNCNLFLSNAIINEGIKNIEDNLKEINELINDIEKSIEKCKSGRNISIGLSLFSSILMGLSLGSYLANHNTANLFSAGSNIGGVVINEVNVVRYTSLIKDLKQLLETTIKEKDEMIKRIEEIKNYIKKQITKIMDGKPKF